MKTTKEKFAYWVFDHVESLDGGTGLSTEYYGPYPYNDAGLTEAIKQAETVANDGDDPPEEEGRRRVMVMVGDFEIDDDIGGPGYACNYDHKASCNPGSGPCSCKHLPELKQQGV